MGKAIGIDLGTSNSAAAVMEDVVNAPAVEWRLRILQPFLKLRSHLILSSETLTKMWHNHSVFDVIRQCLLHALSHSVKQLLLF